MVNRNLIREFDVSDDEWTRALSDSFNGANVDEIDWDQDIDWGSQEIKLNQIVEGKVLRIEGDNVLIDVGYKSEGVIPLAEWGEEEEPPQPGEKLKVLVEEVEDVSGEITQEMLDRGYLAGNSVYACTEHTPVIVDGYFEAIAPIFKLIRECEDGRDVTTLLKGPLCHAGFKRLN